DVAIMSGLALTTWLAHRRDQLATLAAVATATLICTDARFYLWTSASGRPFGYGVAAAVAQAAAPAASAPFGCSPSRAMVKTLTDNSPPVEEADEDASNGLGLPVGTDQPSGPRRRPDR